MRASFLALVLVGCGRNESARPTPLPPPTVSAAAAAASTTRPGEAAEPSIVTSSAVFDRDKLVACADLAITTAPLSAFLGELAKRDASVPTVESLASEDLGVFLRGGKSLIAKAIDKQAGKAVATGVRPSGAPTALSKDCAAQFPGRTVIGACAITVRPKAGGALGLAVGITYYDALLSDEAVRGCLTAGGDWRELEKDSAEFVTAKHEQAYDRLRRELAKESTPQP